VGQQAAALPNSLGLSWQARGGTGIIVVSADDRLSVGSIVGAPRLVSYDWFGRGGHTNDSALSVFADARLFGPGGPDSAPIVLSFGKQAEQIALSLDLSAPALSALARRFALNRSP
jgi:hypothetical protein